MGNTLCPTAPKIEDQSELEGEPFDIDEFQPGLYRVLPEKLIVREGVDAADSTKLKEVPQNTLLDIVNIVLFDTENPEEERLRGELREGGWVSMYYPGGEYFFVVPENIDGHFADNNLHMKDAVSLDFDRKDDSYDGDQYDDNLIDEESDEPLDDIDDTAPSSPSGPPHAIIGTENYNAISPATNPGRPSTPI